MEQVYERCCGFRELRDLTRYRKTLIQQRAAEVNRVQKFLETANIKLGSVATDVLGVSGRAMLDALIAGERDPAQLAKLARGTLRKKRQALVAAMGRPLHPAPRLPARTNPRPH